MILRFRLQINNVAYLTEGQALVILLGGVGVTYRPVIAFTQSLAKMSSLLSSSFRMY